MKRTAGQSLVELALIAPVVLLLVLGVGGMVRLVEARMELDAAVAAAASAASRSADPTAAARAAASSFELGLASYPPLSSSHTLNLGGFQRGGTLVVTGSATWPIGFGMGVLPLRLTLRATAAAEILPWRSR